MTRMNGLLFLLCSLVPGCGQMKQGYMKRGVSLMALFWGAWWLFNFLRLWDAHTLEIPLWLYAFFDSYDLRACAAAGAPKEDELLFGISDLDVQKVSALFHRRCRLMGWGMVTLGIYLLYQQVLERFWSYCVDYLGMELGWLYELLRYDLPRILVSVGIIALGVWFLRGPKKAEEIPTFTPPVEEETEAKDGEA